MIAIGSLFDFKTGSLPALEHTDSGDIPLIYGTTEDNGVVKFVSIDNNDQLFQPPLITVSYLGTAFVQVVPFTTSVVDKSNIIILAPKKDMPLEAMYYYASMINKHAEFGFHYGRRMNMNKLSKLQVPIFKPEYCHPISFKSMLPPRSKKITIKNNLKFSFINICDLFTLKRGDFHAIDRLDPGEYPTISRVTFDNGIVGCFEKPDDAIVHPKLSLTVSTLSGTAFMQLRDFISTDNVVILYPKRKLRQTTLFFIQFMINSSSWRYSYGRQCYKGTFEKTDIYLPVLSNGYIDENAMEEIIRSAEYYKFVEDTISSKSAVAVPGNGG